MRILGFSKKWDKLNDMEFTTFRYPRVDRDWYIGEKVQVFYKNRSPQRERLGIAQIVDRQPRELSPYFMDECQLVSYEECVADGFPNGLDEMVAFMEKQYGLDYISKFNKLTLRWIEKQ